MGNGCCKGGKKIDLVSPALRQLSIRTRMRAADPSVGLAVDRTGALLACSPGAAPEDQYLMVKAGAELALRILLFPTPVVAACQVTPIRWAPSSS